LHGVVVAAEDRLGEVVAHLLLVDVEGGAELDVADVVAAEVDVHQARDEVLRVGVLVVLHTLDERGRAVAHADDRHPNLLAHCATSLIRVCVSTASAPPALPATIRMKLRIWAAMASRSRRQNTSRPLRRVRMICARLRMRRCQLMRGWDTLQNSASSLTRTSA